MFGKKRPKEKPEAAVGVSIKQTSEFSSVYETNPVPLSSGEAVSPPPSYTSSITYPFKDDSLLSSTVKNTDENDTFENSDNSDEEPALNPSYYENAYRRNEDEFRESDEDCIESEEEAPEEIIKPPLNRIMRRKSVFAEAYNPEEEEDESERIIHAKSDEQRVRLGENVKNIFLFRSLDYDQIGEVLDAMFERRVKENEYVIKQGDDGDNFYVIESGIYDIYVETEPGTPPKLVGKYENSGSFGELALMYNLPRAATIQAVSAGSLWAMDRQTFRRIVLNAAYKKRKMYESLLEKVPMLKALQNYERMNLADALVPRMITGGELIIKQGDAADGMYFVEEGSARVVMVNSDNQEKEISRVNVGGYFGELALVTKKPRAASVFAVDKVRLAFLDVEAFERLLGPCMDIMKRNIEDYENELLRIFGSKANISDIR